MNNNEFLEVLTKSFEKYLDSGTSRSTEKPKPLHGAIAEDIQSLFGSEYKVKSQGFGNDKEGKIEGRYYTKNVDITVSKNGKPVAGYAVKFVMRNYAQNLNNYFENMLGETANIRTAAVPYFQIFIVFEEVPYFDRYGEITRYDILNEKNLKKYLVLSNDNSSLYFHTPDKTLIVILKVKNSHSFDTFKEYADYCLQKISEGDFIEYSKKFKDNFGSGVILNDYETFIRKTYYLAEGKN